MLHCELYRERCVRCNGAKVLREHKFAGRHVCRRCNHTHGSWIARPCLHLKTIRDWQLWDGRAKVYEVVEGGLGGNLAGGRVGLAITKEAGRNEGFIEGCGRM
jgi:hypothetical protein